MNLVLVIDVGFIHEGHTVPPYVLLTPVFHVLHVTNGSLDQDVLISSPTVVRVRGDSKLHPITNFEFSRVM